MTPIFCNREFQRSADGWILAVPAGELYNAEADVMQVMDPASLRSIVANWDEQRQRLGENFPGIYVGVEHHIYDPALSSAALGWAKEWRIDEKGIWLRVEWTDLGDEAIRNRRFKFASFCVDPNAPNSLQSLGHGRFRVLKVHTIGLTNLPNGKDLLVPIANRGDGEPAAAVTSEGACRAFGLVVNRKRATLKCSFDHAWSLASKEEPALFAAMHNRQRRSATAPAVERAPRLGPVALNRIAGDMILNLVRTEQAHQGGDFDRHWHRVCNRRPGLVRIMNSAGDAGWLAGLEATAHAEYMQAVQGDVQAYVGENPDSRKFFEGIGALANEFPEIGFEGHWEKLKELDPKLFWQFVLAAGSELEEAP
jgi:hypothetical protein